MSGWIFRDRNGAEVSYGDRVRILCPPFRGEWGEFDDSEGDDLVIALSGGGEAIVPPGSVELLPANVRPIR